jgi:hemoglobin-like flavoprotein
MSVDCLDSDEIKLIRNSFVKIQKISIIAGMKFYENLFLENPEFRPLFKNNMQDQSKKLMASLAFVVASINSIEVITPTLKSLAVLHVKYGVKKEYYPSVGAALIKTIDGALDGSCKKTLSAWSRLYSLVSTIMIEAAYQKDTI